MIRLTNESAQHCDNTTLSTAQTLLLVILAILTLSIHPHTAAVAAASIAAAGYFVGSAYAISHREASVVIKTVCAAISLYATAKLAATLWGVEDTSYITIGDGPESIYRFYGYVVSDILSAIFLLNARNVLNDPHSAPTTDAPHAHAIFGIYPTTILSIATMMGIVSATTEYAGVYSVVTGLVSLSICANILLQFATVRLLRGAAHIYCFIGMSALTSVAAVLEIATVIIDHISGHIVHPMNMLGVADIVGGTDATVSIVLLSVACYMLVTVTRLLNTGGTHE